MVDFKNLKNGVCLAPMAGITDCSFRRICAQMGCDWGVTEMISANGLILSNNENHIQRQLMEKAPGETVGVQLFGCVPDYMARATALVDGKYDFIDINMGCPAPKITKGGAGAALGRDRGLARLVLETVKSATKQDVTVKIRLGWDDASKNYLEMTEMVSESGAAALAIHGRTKVQMYSGRADMDAIAQAVKVATVPVIANGDITTPEEAKRVFEHTGCAAVMIGRGATGNPFLFKQIKDYMRTGSYSAPTPRERLDTAALHTKLLTSLKGEHVAVYEMRKHVGWYIKGLRGAAAMREKINTVHTTDAIMEMLADYLQQVEANE